MGCEIGFDRVGVRFGRTQALAEVSATLAADTITGLVGRNGSGKTTLLRVAAGREIPGAGEVRIGGRSAAVHGQVHLAGDSWPWAADQSVATLASHAARLHPGFSTDAYRAHLARFGLTDRALVGTLSRGQASAARCAVALASRAPVTLLDEPQLGMDAQARETLADLIVAEQSEATRTFVISTHLIDETAPLFEDLLVLDAGRVIAHDAVDALLSRFVQVEGNAAALAGVRLRDVHRLGDRVNGVLERSETHMLPTGVRIAPLRVQRLAGVLPQLTQEATT